MTKPEHGTTPQSDDTSQPETSDKSRAATPPGGDAPDPDFQEGATIPAASD